MSHPRAGARRGAPPRQADLARWYDQLCALQAEVHALLDPLNDTALNWKPGPGAWSIAECIDHLTVTGGGLVRHARPAVAAARARGITGTGPFDPGWLGRWFIRQVGPNPRRPARTPAVFAPGSTLAKDRLLPGFAAMQHDVLDLLRAADGLRLDRIRVRSAVTPFIRLNLAAWFPATIAHEHRHLAQARRVATDPELARRAG